jgi:hypothetical protein
MEEKNVHCIARERKEESRKPMQLWDSLGEKKTSLFSGNGTAAEKPKGWEAAVLLRSTEIHWVQASFSLQLA